MTDDKPRGFLTADDRDYLDPNRDKKLTEGSEYNTRARIIERAEQGFDDFSLLYNHMSQQDRERLFLENPPDSTAVRTDSEFRDNIIDTLAFIFESTGLIYHLGSDTKVTPMFSMIEAAIKQAGADEGYHVENVEFGVEGEGVNVDKARKKLKERGVGVLRPAEISILVREGHADLVLTD